MREVNFYQTAEETAVLLMGRILSDQMRLSECIDQIGVCGATHPELSKDSLETYSKIFGECKAKMDMLAALQARRDQMVSRHRVSLVVAHEVVRGVSHG